MKTRTRHRVALVASVALATPPAAQVQRVYPGTHTSKVADRFQNHVMPFFSRSLCAKGDCP